MINNPTLITPESVENQQTSADHHACCRLRRTCYPTGNETGACHPTGSEIGACHPTGHQLEADHLGCVTGASHPTGHQLEADHLGYVTGACHPFGYVEEADHLGFLMGASHPTNHVQHFAYIITATNRTTHQREHLHDISLSTLSSLNTYTHDLSFLLIRAGDVESNPGPNSLEQYRVTVGSFYSIHLRHIFSQLPTCGCSKSTTSTCSYYASLWILQLYLCGHKLIHNNQVPVLKSYSDHQNSMVSTKRKLKDLAMYTPITLYNLCKEEQYFALLCNLCFQTSLSIICAAYLFAYYMRELLLCAGDIETNPGPTPRQQQKLTKRQKQQLRKEKDKMRKQRERKIDNISVHTCNKTDTVQVEHVEQVNIDLTKEEYEYELATPCTNLVQSSLQREPNQSTSPLSIIRGHFSQANERIFGDSSGQQCTCNAITMLCVWQTNKSITSDCINAILLEGDRLFRKLSLLLRQTGISSEQFRYLEFREIELLSPLTISDQQCTIELGDCMTGAVQSVTASDRSIFALGDAISLALSQKSQALMMIGAFAMAIVKTSGMIGLFDSHTHSEDGSFHVADGCAAFMLFRNETAVANFLQQNFAGHDQYDIFPVTITSAKRKDREHFMIASAESTNFSENTNKDVPKKCSEGDALQNKRKRRSNSPKPKSTSKKQKTTNSSFDHEHTILQEKNKVELNIPGLSDTPEELQTYFSDQKTKSVKQKVDHTKIDTLLTAKKIQLKFKRAEYMRTYMKMKRKIPEKNAKEREQQMCYKQFIRNIAERRAKERQQETISKQCRRKDPEKRAMERQQETVSKQCARKAPEKRAKERRQETVSKQCARKDPQVQEKERVSKQLIRKHPERRAKER